MIRRRLADVEQLRASTVKLERTQELLKTTLSQSRNALQRRKMEIQALGKQSPSLSISLLSAIRLSGVEV